MTPTITITTTAITTPITTTRAAAAVGRRMTDRRRFGTVQRSSSGRSCGSRMGLSGPMALSMVVAVALAVNAATAAAAAAATGPTRSAFATLTSNTNHHHHPHRASSSTPSPPWLVWHSRNRDGVRRRQRHHGPRWLEPPTALPTRLWDSTNSNNNNSNNSLVAVSSDGGTKTQLLSAFTNLGVADQYDAVLTGLCAKILDATTSSSKSSSSKPSSNAPTADDDDETTTTTDTAAGTPAVTLRDCMDLLHEMNTHRIAASPRSLMALVDSTVKAQDASVMASVLSQCIRNRNGIRQYGSQQADVIPFPSSYTTRVTCPGSNNNNKKKTIVERLETLPPVPVDDRVSEIASAGAFAVAVASCEVTNLVLPNDDASAVLHFIANAALTILVTVTAVDNGYDVLQTASNFLLSRVGTTTDTEASASASTTKAMGATIASTVSNWKLPNKDQLPFGLGTGQITGSVVRGFARLTTVDPEREAECEAAALYTAYALGLPCFAFRPNALEASVLVVESSSSSSSTTSSSSVNDSSALDNLLSPSGILRMLVWLMAAPAMESMTHAQLIMSEPREAQGFLQRLEEYYQRNAGGNNNNDDDGSADLFWMDDTIKVNTGDSRTVRDDLLQWAYTEADLLLRANRNVVNELSIRLSSGAATIGDCVAVIEKW